MMRSVYTVLPAVFAVQLVSTAAYARNYLVVMIDDFGVDKASTYQSDYPTAGVQHVAQMDTVDSLADAGVRFTRAWSNPVCVPTRASLHTGAHPSRHELGLNLDIAQPGLDPDSWDLIGEVFAARGHRTGYFGKWQVGNEDASGRSGYPLVTPFTVAPHPARAGFADFDGALEGIGAGGGYNNWERMTWSTSTGTGTYAVETRHPTEVLSESAAGWIFAQTAPWIAFIGYQAPHSGNDGTPVWKYGDADPACYRSPELSCLATESCADEALSVYQALAECVDIELETLLTGMDPAMLDDTTIVFAGDNGTPAEQLEGTFRIRNRGKGSVYESGVRIPFVLTDGKTWRTGTTGVISNPGRTSNATISTTDLYATLLDDAFDAPAPFTDSRSFAGCWTNTAADCGFGTPVGYSESFEYNSRGLLKSGQAALRTGGTKVMVRYIPKQGCLQTSGTNTDTDPYELTRTAANSSLLASFASIQASTAGWGVNVPYCP
jgi:arylsulfatase A-like enzyme